MEFENLLTLVRTVSKSGLTDFEYEENGVKLHLAKQPGLAEPSVRADADPAADTDVLKEPESRTSGSIVRSPLVGIFYAAPAEDAEPFVRVGDTVKKGQTLAIIEAMKLMNEIESDYDGVIEEIYLENGQAAEYGQPLFRIV